MMPLLAKRKETGQPQQESSKNVKESKTPQLPDLLTFSTNKKLKLMIVEHLKDPLCISPMICQVEQPKIKESQFVIVQKL